MPSEDQNLNKEEIINKYVLSNLKYFNSKIEEYNLKNHWVQLNGLA
jgi:hypothetical protein